MTIDAPLTLEALALFVQGRRLPLDNEKATQRALEQALTAAGIAHRREVPLDHGNVIDFLVDGIGVELKLKGSARAIYRQLERYSEHGEVRAILLLTGRAMGLPSTIKGKPAAVASLGRAWL